MSSFIFLIQLDVNLLPVTIKLYHKKLLKIEFCNH